MYGAARRRLQVVKLRGVDYRGGFHDFAIKRGGLVVFPRLVAGRHLLSNDPEPANNDASMSSGVAEIDQLLGGGLDRGSSSLIMGPAGVGKSSLATQYAVTAAKKGHRVAMFAFDETRKSLFARSESLGMHLTSLLATGHLTVQQIDPAELAPGEFANLIRRSVEDDGTSMIVIDSLNGYLNAMPAESYLTLHLHELLGYLAERGVATILVLAQHGLIGPGMTSAADVSYLADCVILLRYFEAEGEIMKAISVLKKRSGTHEKAIRNFELSPRGICVGEPLKHFRGILSGIPTLDRNDRDAGESERR